MNASPFPGIAYSASVNSKWRSMCLVGKLHSEPLVPVDEEAQHIVARIVE